MSYLAQGTLFEILAGIFGWGWIAAWLYLFYSLILFIFYSGEGSIILYSFGLVILCKWLAKGFGDNAKRVMYEQDLVKQGLTQKEAGKKWLEEYLKR